MSAILGTVVKEGAKKLALRFPSSSLKGSGAALATAMSEEGFLVRPGARIEAWSFEGIEEEEGGAFVVGPYFEGSSLDDARDPAEGMASLLALARAFAALAEAGRLPRGLVSSGILLSPAGGGSEARSVLVLPPSATAKALSSQAPEARAAAVARLASPLSKSPEADASFLMAQAAYRFAAGESAFERESAERGAMAGTRRYSISAGLAAPRLDAALAALIDAALEDPDKVGLEAWLRALEAASASGWLRELSPAEEAELARRRAAEKAGRARRLSRDAFLRRRGGLLVGIGIGIALVGFVAADMARAARSRPDFSGLPALEVARHYYAAIDGLDLDSLEACGEKDAIKADRDVLMSLVVLTRTRMAYEGRNPLLPARDWIARGMNPLKETDFLYGIVGLELAEADSSGAEAGISRFRASYSLWSLERTDAPSGEPSEVRTEPVEDRRVDELVLKRGKKGWKIVGLERRHP